MWYDSPVRPAAPIKERKPAARSRPTQPRGRVSSQGSKRVASKPVQNSTSATDDRGYPIESSRPVVYPPSIPLQRLSPTPLDKERAEKATAKMVEEAARRKEKKRQHFEEKRRRDMQAHADKQKSKKEEHLRLAEQRRADDERKAQAMEADLEQMRRDRDAALELKAHNKRVAVEYAKAKKNPGSKHTKNEINQQHL